MDAVAATPSPLTLINLGDWVATHDGVPHYVESVRGEWRGKVLLVRDQSGVARMVPESDFGKTWHIVRRGPGREIVGAYNGRSEAV